MNPDDRYSNFHISEVASESSLLSPHKSFYLLLAESNVASHKLHIKRCDLCGRLSTMLVDISDVLGQSGQGERIDTA